MVLISHHKKQLAMKRNREENEHDDIRGKGLKVGNFPGYYAYRKLDSDKRLDVLDSEWFSSKKCWDIGCNSGAFTRQLAKQFNPAFMIGTDVDKDLIDQAIYETQLEVSKHKYFFKSEEEEEGSSNETPKSIQQLQDKKVRENQNYLPPLRRPIGLAYPYNITYCVQNAVDGAVPSNGMFDTVTCLSVSKWIHLYYGDIGLQKVFKAVFDSLLPGGKFIFEPQPWKSYQRRKKTTETTFKNYLEITMRPKDFGSYLTNTVGFVSCEKLAAKHTSSFKRPIFVLTKP